MNSLRRKRVYGVVMVLAAAALAVDRFGFSNEQAAGFSMSADLAQGALRGSVDQRSSARETVSTVSIPELPFPRGVAVFDLPASGDPCRDLFAPPQSVVNRNSAGTPTDSNDSATNRSKRANRTTFLTRHSLSGVLLFESLKIAIVDGMWLRKGQLLDGCTLKSVSGNEARFECYDGEAVLKVTNTKSLTRD